MKTHCKRGHPRTPENVKRNRGCRLCEAARNALWQRAHAELIAARARNRHHAHPEDWRRYAARRRLWPVLEGEQPETVVPMGIWL